MFKKYIKYFILGAITLAAFAILCPIILNQPEILKASKSSFMARWGESLNHSWKERSVSKTSNLGEDSIYKKGNRVSITNADIERATKFFQLSGDNETVAREKAIIETEQLYALYAEAINKGYSVTDQEVKEYLNELKELLNTANNKEDIQDLIQAFNSEEEYWEFQFSVYQINLPVQKYVKDIEEAYMKELQISGFTGDADKEWSDHFEALKEELVKKEAFK